MKRLIALVTVAVLLAGGAVVFLNAGRWLASSDPRRPVDVVVVSSGDLDARLPVALDALERGDAEHVWVLLQPPGPVLEADAAVREFTRGDPRVEVIGDSRSMRTDAITVARLVERLRPREPVVAVLTAPWQTTRASLTFGRLAPGAKVLAWPDGRPFDADRWWQDDAFTVAVEVVELVGTLALFGARPVVEGEAVPLSLPVRALVGGFVAAVLAGFLVRPLAVRLGLVAHPRLFRAHAHAVPMLGGVAVLGGLGVGVLAGGGFSTGAAGAVAAGGIIALALVGFVDDLVGLGARSRIVWAAGAGLGAWLLGFRTIVLTGGTEATVVNAIVTVLWFVGITHAVNLLDNLDGAAAGVGTMSALGIAVVAMSGGQWVVALGAAALAGGTAGYLVHNVHPARLFMGDLGALGLGFALAALALALRPAQEAPLSFVVAVLALGVPIFDAALVTVSRLRARRPVLVGGTDHTAHRLIARGFTVRQAAGALWVVQVALSAAAWAVAEGARSAAWALTGVLALAGTGALVLFVRLPAWRPPTEPETLRDTLAGVEDVLGPLRRLIERAHKAGIDTSDPTAVRSLEETERHLERTRRMLEEDHT